MNFITYDSFAEYLDMMEYPYREKEARRVFLFTLDRLHLIQ